LILAVSGSALGGAAVTSAFSSAEAAARAGLLDCAIVREAEARGLGARRVVPTSWTACRTYLESTVAR
jgi:hypothetical protein